MPELTHQGLDVTAEEERFLKRAFRRFALPYVILLVAFTWWMASPEPPPQGPVEELAALQQELEALRAEIAGLGERVAGVDARASEAAELASEDDGSASEVEKLRGELRRATGRIASLEKKLGKESVSERFAALTDRLAGLEVRVRAQATPAAMPAAPAPRARPRPPAPAGATPGR